MTENAERATLASVNSAEPMRRFLSGQKPVASLLELRWRSAEGGNWNRLASETSMQEIDKILNNPPWASSLRPGDILRVDSASHTLGWYGVTDNGRISRLPPTSRSWTCQREGACQTWIVGLSWPDAWETCENATWMLWAVRSILDRSILMRAAAACVRAQMPENEVWLSGILRNLEMWTPGRNSMQQLNEIRDALAEVLRGFREQVNEQTLLLNAVSFVASIPEGQTYLASMAVESSLGTLRGDAREHANAELSDIVRQVIPLRFIVRTILSAPSSAWSSSRVR